MERPRLIFLITRWISAKAEYGDGGAEIHWASDVIPYLMKLHENGNYTMYQLENVGGLKSAYRRNIKRIFLSDDLFKINLSYARQN
jgi:plasmid replication initiation protein